MTQIEVKFVNEVTAALVALDGLPSEPEKESIRVQLEHMLLLGQKREIERENRGDLMRAIEWCITQISSYGRRMMPISPGAPPNIIPGVDKTGTPLGDFEERLKRLHEIAEQLLKEWAS